MSDERLARLEERFAWLERHGLEQDRAMAEMGDEIRRLRGEIAALKERARNEGGAGSEPEPEESPPPHY